MPNMIEILVMTDMRRIHLLLLMTGIPGLRGKPWNDWNA